MRRIATCVAPTGQSHPLSLIVLIGTYPDKDTAMQLLFWLRRFLLVYALGFAVLMIAESLKGHALIDALGFSGWWALMSASVYLISAYDSWRRGNKCAWCVVPEK